MTASPDSERPPSPSQSGAFAVPHTRPALRKCGPRICPSGRREDLLGLRVGGYTEAGDWLGWEVVGDARDGCWLAQHHCGMHQEMRLDGSVIYAPRCKGCGVGAPGFDVRAARQKHFAETDAFRVGKYSYRRR
jgi:hypothetical protein